MAAVEDSQPELEGTLFMAPGRVLFVGRHLRSDLHSHFGPSITVSLEGALRYRAADSDWVESTTCVARSNAEFAIEGGSARVVNLQLDVEKGESRLLHALEGGQSQLMSLRDEVAEPLRAALRAHLSTPKPSGRELQRLVFAALHQGPIPKARFDVRITRVLTRLKDSLPLAPSTAELAAEVELSEGRLIHLFSEQLGVPLRRYVMWLRVRYLMFFMAMGQTLTDAAHAAGFADSAHFSRVYREMFGFPPSKLLRSDKVRIQPEAPEPEPGDPNYERDRRLMKQMMQEQTQRIVTGANASRATSSRAGRKGAP